MHLVFRWWRPPAVALAAAMLFAAPALGESMPLAERIAQCSGCHGEDGNSRMENIPSLAGQPEFFLVNQLFLMRERVRPIEAMMPFVQGLKDEDINGLAKHFAALAPKPSDELIDPALARRGAELAPTLRCGSCHMPDLSGQQQMPRLARQRVDYLISSLKSFRDNTRSGADTLMSNVVAGLPDGDLAALAHYSASQ
jgi:cytochrome c553